MLTTLGQASTDPDHLSFSFLSSITYTSHNQPILLQSTPPPPPNPHNGPIYLHVLSPLPLSSSSSSFSLSLTLTHPRGFIPPTSNFLSFLYHLPPPPFSHTQKSLWSTHHARAPLSIFAQSVCAGADQSVRVAPPFVSPPEFRERGLLSKGPATLFFSPGGLIIPHSPPP